MYTLHLRIDGLPKTMNGMMAKANWYAFKKEADLWKGLVALHSSGKRPPAPLKQAKLTLVRHSSNRPDWDNLVSGFKRAVDGLVESQILEDDSMDHIGIPEFKWFKAPPKKGFIEIFVEEICS